MHHPKPKGSCRRKKADSKYECVEEDVTDSLKFDNNACGEYTELTHAGKLKSADVQREATKGERHAHRQSKKPHAKAREIAFRHHVLPAAITNTKLVFRKKKSFNDAVQTSIASKDKVRGREWERKHNYRFQRSRDRDIRKDDKCDKKEETEQQNEAVVGNSKEEKQRRRKSLQKGHKSTDRSPFLTIQNFSKVQKVIYCQVSHVSPLLENDETVAEVKYLYRRSKRGSKDDNQLVAEPSGRKSDPCSKTSADPDIGKVEQDLIKFKKKSKRPENEEFAAEMSNADYKSKLQRRGSIMPIESRKLKDARNTMRNVKWGTGERAGGQWRQKIKLRAKNHVTRECGHSRKCSRDQHFQSEDHKIYKIVEEIYLRKIQSLIHRKLSTLINKSKEIELKVEHASNGCKSVMKGRKRYKSGECVKGNVTRSTMKADIVNEALKRLKERPISEKGTRRSEEKFSTRVTTVNVHKNFHDSATKVFTNRTHQRHDSRRTFDRIRSKDHAGLAKNQEDSRTLRNICPDQFPDNLVPIHKSRHNYGHRRRLQEDKTIHSPIRSHHNQARSSEQRSQTNHPQLRMMTPYNSDSSSEQEIVSTSREIVRYHESNPRSCSPWKFVQEPDHQKISTMKAKLPSYPQNELLRSPPKTHVAQGNSHLRQIFGLPGSFRESQTHANGHDFSVNGIEPPIQDFKSGKKARSTKRPKCKVVLIIAIHPHGVRIDDVIGNKVKKYSDDRDVLEKRKLCRRFKSYYKYSAIEDDASEGSCDGRTLMSDSTRMVSSLSGEETINEQYLQNKNQRVETEVLQDLKNSNQIWTTRNSNLNNTVEGFSDIFINDNNEQYFVPITGTNEFYCRRLTSSRSENYLNNQDSHDKIPSQNGDHEIRVCCEEGKCRFYGPHKSHTDSRLFANLNLRRQMNISKSDVAICGGAKQVVKTTFKPNPRPQSNTNRLQNNFPLSIEKITGSQTTPCKEYQAIKPRECSCPEGDANSILEGVGDSQGPNVVQRPIPPVNDIDLAVDSPLPANEMDLTANSSFLDIKVDLTVAPPIGTTGRRKNNELEAELVVNVAQGESELTLPIKGRRVKKRVEIAYVRNRKSTTVSPIGVIKESPMQVAKKDSRKIIRRKQPPLSNSQQKTPTHRQNPLQTGSTRRMEIKSIRYESANSRMQVKVELSPAITLKCIKVFRSSSKNMLDIARKQSVQKIQTSEEAVSGIRGEAVPFGVSRIGPETNEVQSRKPASVAESYFHCHDPFGGPNTRCLTLTITDNNPLIDNGVAVRSYQSGSFGSKEATEGSFSLVSDVGNSDRLNRKSKSLVNVKRPLRDDTDRPKSEIRCGNAGSVDRNEFVVETKGGSCISNDIENTTEKFANNFNLRDTSQSHGSHQYVTNRLSTGLIGAYQKRKVYGTSRGKKMKKNFIIRKDGRHESYEVKSTVACAKHMLEISILGLNKENVLRKDRDKTSASASRGPEVAPAGELKNDDCKSEKDGISMTMGEDQERLEAMCKRLLNLQAMVDDMFQESVCTCLQFAQQCSACKNFLALIDNIQSLFARYRSESNGHLGKSQEGNSPDVLSPDPPSLDDRSESERYLEKSQKENSSDVQTNIGFPSASENSPESKRPHEKSEEGNSSGIPTIAAPAPALCDTLSIVEIYSAGLHTFSSDSALMVVPSDKELHAVEFINCESPKENGWRLIIQSMSCPTLATTFPSFKFFSEDEASIDNEAINRETFLVDLFRPFDHTFNINTCQYNMDMSHFAESNSESAESGYSTIRSSRYSPNRLVNFFGRLKIAALFKPSRSTRRTSNEDLNENICSEEMTKSGQRYARKVRQMNSLRESDEQENTEFSLQFLLSKSESATLENRASSISGGNELTENEHMAATVKDGAEISEPQFLEIKEIERAPSSCPLGGWKLTLRNSCLNNKSEIKLGSTFVANLMNDGKLHKAQKQPLGYNDASMVEFLKALIRAYDKEVEVCNKLYDDKEFYNVILGLIQEQKRQKKRAFFKIFSWKSVSVRRRKVVDTKSAPKLFKKLKIKLQSLGSNARKRFPELVEALRVNGNVNHDQKISAISEWLERINDGEFQLEQNGENNDHEARIAHHIKDSLVVAYQICLKGAGRQKRKIGSCEIKLLMLVVMKYKFCLLYKADVIISSIGRGVISSEFQLKTAVTYLAGTNVEKINRSKFEGYCRSINK
ncbi:uncharacterized protein [Euwallacea fornicatus]|uniref:uncharacterized protein isoform X2 n=1 Tax=Euwallacea fornicatus TaxID=995702 RepID=UPI00338FF7C5